MPTEPVATRQFERLGPTTRARDMGFPPSCNYRSNRRSNPDILDLLEAMGADMRKLNRMRRERWRKRPRCGARTRQGGSCQIRAVCMRNGMPRNGRCRLHGGLSTGPRTAEGKARIAAANRRRSLNTSSAKEEPA